jgi:hypothetical protein
MISKQYVEKQFWLDKELKRENKETKEHKDVKDKDKDKEKEHKEFKEIRKEEVLEYPQTHYPVADPGPELAAAQPAMQFGKTVETKQIAEKYIHKDYIKEHKLEIKEYFEKWHYEGKVVYEGPGETVPGGDPYTQRIAALESAVTQLLHFIPAELRPDLSQGALKQEPDAEKKPEPEAGKAHKK